MTRDEAVTIAVNNQADCIVRRFPLPERIECAVADIRTLVALGVLKLDGLKNADDRLAEVVMSTFSFDTNEKEMVLFRKELEAAGLQIIERT